MATVSDGVRHVVLQPKQLPDFIRLHNSAEFVFHNVPFDYFVIEKELVAQEAGVGSTTELWRKIYKDGRFHDTMLMDQLLRLARNDPRGVFHRDLNLTARDYDIDWINKDDDHRTRYKELLGREREWSTLDPSWFKYAVLDTVAVSLIWPKMLEEAKTAYYRAGVNDRTAHNLTTKFGPLTEKIQVGAAVALAGSEKNGFALDIDKVSVMADGLKTKILDIVGWFNENHPDIFHRYKIKSKQGQAKYGPSDLVPKMDQKHLESVLRNVAERQEIFVPFTDKGNVKRSLDLWREIAPNDIFVDSWSKLADLTKLYQFVTKLQVDVLHPSYITLVRTGRTSSRDPNIQNMPRGPEFRGMFIARPGKKLVIADYSAIELVTLASVLQVKYGNSKLADVLRAGVDPHAYTASLIIGIDPNNWTSYAAANKQAAKLNRQSAKALNFGIPGGLGKDKLSWYAKSTYGVDMSVSEAAAFKDKIVNVVYPELGLYLEDTSFSDLARNLSLPLEQVWNVLDTHGTRESWLQRPIRNVVSGMPYNFKGEPYKTEFVNRIWEGLDRLAKLSMRLGVEWKVAIRQRNGSPELDRRLFQARAITLTGRIRSGVSYTEERNTKFQGLAADGAKLALWKLTAMGYKIVAFVHDEVVVEVDADRAEVEAGIISTVMSEEMSKALQNNLPVKVAYEVSDRWEKP